MNRHFKLTDRLLRIPDQILEALSRFQVHSRFDYRFDYRFIKQHIFRWYCQK